MSAFDNLPLVIEPAQLAERLDAADLILLDLSSAARYADGHIAGARWVDAKRTQRGQPPAPACCRSRPSSRRCSPISVITRMPFMWSTTTKAAPGPVASSGCST